MGTLSSSHIPKTGILDQLKTVNWSSVQTVVCSNVPCGCLLTNQGVPIISLVVRRDWRIENWVMEDLVSFYLQGHEYSVFFVLSFGQEMRLDDQFAILPTDCNTVSNSYITSWLFLSLDSLRGFTKSGSCNALLTAVPLLSEKIPLSTS